ncbi:MAG TPA: trypsin-like peptidase domain-containing protein [Planctomicrobium sp.]|nr:trypsin-like peptidase domain-containing protein [Planctomicrobium sp.]
MVVPTGVLETEAQRIEIMRKVAPSVVAIFASGGNGGGSGVLIEETGFAITNFHVVTGLGGFMKCGLNDGKLYDAVLVGIDPTGDVALIQLLGRTDFPTATIGDSDTVRAGDMVFAMGNPFLLASDYRPTVTYGMVSGVHRYQEPAGTILEYTDCIQVDASINPGNSGGPLFNSAGELIGINGRISVEKRGRVNVGAGYAISINQVMHFLEHLRSGRIVDHATLGATVTGTADGSVVVAGLLENSSAFRRGLRWGDEIVSFAGRPIRSVNQFKNILGIFPKGWTVPLTYRRDGKRFDIEVRLMGLHRRAELTGGGLEDPLEEPPPRPPEDPDEDSPEKKTPETPKATVPEQYASLYEERDGYANYYFNQLAQKRLLKHFDDYGDYRIPSPRWVLTGTLNNTTPVDIRLLPEAVAAKIGSGFMVQNLNEEFRDIPPGSGGLLAALEHLKHFLADRDDYFTELFYLGREPLAGTQDKVDVLVSSKGLVTTRWYFRPESGQFIGFDTALEEDADPCEIRFSEWRSQGKIQVPVSFTVRSGDQNFGEIKVNSLEILPAAEEVKP